MINKAILLGNVGKDPEIKHLENGASVARISLATNKNYKDKSGEWQNVATWHDIVAWRYLADYVEKNIKKGSLIYVEGEITKRKYQDKDGNDRYVCEIVAHTVKSLDKKEPGTKSEELPNDDLPF